MSETDRMTLTDFLLARVGEDEAAAREATPGPWNAGAEYADANVWAGDDHSMGIAHASWEHDESSAANFAHIARHDPARVLAECEAKRRVVEDCSPVRLQDYDESASALAEVVLAALALPYRDHPDFQEAWLV